MDIDRESLKSIRYVIGMSLLTKLFILVEGILFDLEFAHFEVLGDYRMAFSQIILLSSILAGGFVLSLVGVYRKIEEEEGRERVFSHMNNLLSIVGVAGLVMTIFLLVLVSLNLVDLGSPEYTRFFLLGIPMVSMEVLRSILLAFLQMRHGFFAGPMGNLVRIVLYYLYLLVVGNRLGLEGLMFFGNLTLVIQIIIAYSGTLNHGYSFDFKIDFKDTYLLDGFKGIVYMALTLYIYGFTVDSKHDNSFVGIFQGCIISSLVTVVYPLLCEKYQLAEEEGLDLEEFTQVFLSSLGLIIKWMIPMLVIGLLGSDLLNRAFRTGNMGNFLISHGIGFISICLLPLLFRTMIAYGDFNGPLFLSVIAFLIGYFLKKYRLVRLNFIAYDLGLAFALLISFIRINSSLDFIHTRRFKFYLLNGIRSSIFQFIFLFLVDFVLINIMDLNLDPSILVYSFSILGILVYFIAYEKGEKKIRGG